MAELSPGQNAKQMVEKQLEALGSLYNAGVRSQSFREWRQATLTCIQRIWPAEPARPERFRRIPFSPPMGRPDERAVREYYERGCGEAASLLKDYIAEIATVGLPGPIATPPASGAPAAPRPDDFPTRELPGPPSGASAAGSMKPQLRELLGFAEAAPAAPVAPETPGAAPAAGPGAPPLPQSPAPAPTAAGQGAPPLPQSTVSTPAPASPANAAPPGAAAAHAMAELESRGFFAPPGHALREASAGGPAGSPTPQAPQPRIVVTGNESPASAPPSRMAPAAETAGAGAADPNDLERVADELLRASTALSSLPRRPAPERKPGVREVRSPVPLAIAALALDVEALGVPEGHRSRVRAMLLDLSRRLDAPNLSWDALRDAMNFVMEFPTLGRRLVPLLLPYFDRAA